MKRGEQGEIEHIEERKRGLKDTAAAVAHLSERVRNEGREIWKAASKLVVIWQLTRNKLGLDGAERSKDPKM